MAQVPKTIRLCATAVAVIVVPMLLASCGGGGGSAAEVPPDPIPLGEYSLGGTITVSTGVAVDKDTNDPNAPASTGLDNDFPYDSPDDKLNIIYDGQLIPNPGTLGGFVAFAGQGNPGPATTDTDWNDFFRVSLLEGQSISLAISDHIEADPTRVDLDLLLLDLDLNLVDVSAGIGPQESLTVEAAGEYFVWVTVCADTLPRLLDNDRLFICGNGASNYTLSVGQSEAAAAVASLRLSGDFVPGEALVRYRDTPTIAAAEESGAPFRATASSAAADSPQVGNITLFKFADEPLVATATAVLPDASDVNSAGNQQSWVNVTAEQRAKLATIAKIKELGAQPDVGAVEPNYIRQALFEPNDPGYQYQWHYPLINLPTAWDLFGSDPMGMLGANVTVAVLDTGILPLHPDFENQPGLLTGGYDFVSSVSSARDGDGADPNPTDPGDSSFSGFSSSFHGTHVAGTIAAATNNNTGVAGVAPDARIMAVRVLGQGGGTNFDIQRGLCFAAGLSGGPNCAGVPVNSRPADIINLSLGGTDSSLLEQNLINELATTGCARATGCIIVAAAGNSASNVPFYPAAYDGVIAVSAVTINQSLAPYSSFGIYVDVAAPGGDTSQNIDGDPYVDGVVSTGGNDARGPVDYTYPFFQGTSMAAPHVAGVFALMRSINADLTPATVTAMLAAGELTIPLGELVEGGRNDSFGYGLIDAQKSVAAALASDGSPPAPQPWLGVFPSALNFGATLESLVISVRNNSGGDLNVLSIESSDPWLTAPSVNGLTDYEVRVDRDGLSEGSHSATLTITSNVNVVTVPVILQKSNVVLTGNAGHLYVRLIEAVTGRIREVETDVQDGSYAWQIEQLPPGEYQLVAYTDADNDNRVCDPGEACGSYLTVDQPIFIELTEDQPNLTGLDFQVSFGVALADPNNPDKP